MARVLLGVTGGIAAYKAPQLVRDLQTAGHEVRVVMTRSAQRFVAPLSLATVSQHPVHSDLFAPPKDGDIGHIELARWPDCILVAPATADLLARAALGRCDDLLSTVLLATNARILMAPAMNGQMWAHRATQKHCETLAARGIDIIAPVSGDLACGEQGVGKMADLSDITRAVHRRTRQDWGRARVLVTAGPTREYLDGVRFISNGSTGTMGFALAQAAAIRGAKVDLVAGPVNLATPPGVSRYNVQSAQEMYERCEALLSSSRVDWVFKVAAVADLALEGASSEKRDKSGWTSQPWRFVATRDVLASLTPRFSPQTRFLAFAAQTAVEGGDASVARQLIEKAQDKMKRKGCDAIFVNRVFMPSANTNGGLAPTGFGSGDNGGFLLRSGMKDPVSLGHDRPMPKSELANAILDHLQPCGCANA